jgi:hypothetical protein
LGKFYRAKYWKRKNEPISDPIDERTQRVFKVGELFHHFIEDIIKKNEEVEGCEVLIENENFKGFADIVLRDEVIDIKSQHSQAFHYRRNLEWEVLKDMLHTNILQVVWYAINLNKPRARLVFVSKDDLCIQEYSFPIDEKLQKEYDKEVSNLIDIWQKQALPPATPRAYKNKENKPQECKYCSWKTLCTSIKKGK